ncbi:riboflavin synthase subunit alpha [Pseudoalteromonas denitrificans]|uniref:Riboflavin synthase n=1 Tax=Pseudoalteromonas denitrificans DSM 6059 TaxID=1123010 RepID=A0A1I1NTI8_9GAMM|nr:riboflavin synthase subunit alpha [Pseudoalteromonas denitrificans]SFD00981.1 riboflavin synthase alpha chain [Pseudoalteromonas denitrificans DSM 6059]
MFTGIVQTQATVISVSELQGIKRLVLSVPGQYLQHLDLGASIAINGCCLTVVHFELGIRDVVGQVYFDIIDETLRLTNLGLLIQGQKVNFERSVCFGTELGGHIVSGHIHTTAVLSDINYSGDNCSFKFTVDNNWMKYIIHKGFVSINGASLTVGDVNESSFYVHLIPETLKITNLGLANVNDKINIEVDQQTYTIINTVERYMKNNM